MDSRRQDRRKEDKKINFRNRRRFDRRMDIEEFKKINGFPVFDDAVESVRAMRVLRDYWQGRNHTRPA